MTDWQPIETAPRDRVLDGVVNGEVRLIQWGKASHVPLHGWCLADQGPEDFDLCHPTHWAHRAAPPPAVTPAADKGEPYEGQP